MATQINGRMPRGSNPPHLLLSEAFRLIESIWEQGGGHCSFDILSRITKNSTSSSSFIKKLNALKAYDLVIEANKSVALTDVGRDIVAPTSPSTGLIAKKTSFLSIDVFSKLYERHKGKLLPADEFLRNIIEQDSKIPRELVDSWIISFKDAANAANLLFHRSDGKIQITDTATLSSSPPLISETVLHPPSISPAPSAPPMEPNSAPITDYASGHTTRIQLSGNRFAIFSIPDSLDPKDGKKLKSALTGLTSIIDSLIKEEEDARTD